MKVYAIDTENNRKVIGFYDSKKEAQKLLRQRFESGETGCIHRYFVFWVENVISFVSEKKMKEAVRKHGSRMEKSWN